MKTEFTEVSETRKHLSFEVPPDALDAEIDRVARGYSRKARVPGFRPGRVPAAVVRQRYREEILQDVAQALIPRLVGEALRERGLEPVAAPDIRDLVLEEGRPLTFVADFETLPPVEPGEYTGIPLRRPPAVLEVGAVDRALEHLRERAARWDPVEDRPARAGDTVLMDLTRARHKPAPLIVDPAAPLRPPDTEAPETLTDASIELGASGNPAGFDDHLHGVAAGDTRTFTLTHAPDGEAPGAAPATVDYRIVVKAVRRKALPDLDDGFAREVSDLDSLDTLRHRIREDLQREAEREAEHAARHQLLGELASRLTAVPDALVEREIDRRLEELVRRLMEQGVDPMKAGIDWQEFRVRQRQPAAETVRGTLVLDEIARREGLEATDEDLAAEIARFAERVGRTPAAVRARLEKDDGLDRIRAGILREKTMAWLMERAHVVTG